MDNDWVSAMKLKLRKLLVSACLAVGLAACSPELQMAEHQRSVRAIGLVRAIDREARTMDVSVNFRRLRLKVAPDVSGFDTVKVGDRFKVRYRFATTARQLPDGAELAPLTTRLKLSPPGGDRPGNGLLRVRRVTAEFVGFDHRSKLTTLKLSDGRYVDLLATGPFEIFVFGLSRGDRVEVMLEEAIAVLVAPVR